MDITYFESPGEQNTESVLGIVKKRCEDLGIKYVLVPSVRGISAEKSMDKFENTEVTLFFVGIDPAKFSTETQKRIEQSGFKLVFYKQIDYAYPDEMKNAFRRFGQGTKVAVELALIGTRGSGANRHRGGFAWWYRKGAGHSVNYTASTKR